MTVCHNRMNKTVHLAAVVPKAATCSTVQNVSLMDAATKDELERRLFPKNIKYPRMTAYYFSGDRKDVSVYRSMNCKHMCS